MKCAKKCDRVLLFLLALVLVTGGVVTVCCPSPAFSAQENRYLAPMPALTRHSIQSGEYTKGVETYLTEHLPTRGVMREVRAVCELSLGKRIVDGVLLCPAGRLVALPAENERAWRQNQKALARLAVLAVAQGIPYTQCVLPAQASIPALLPADFSPIASKADASMQAYLNHEAYWYRTDHHMTTAGAFALYTHLASALSISPYCEGDFTPLTVSASFRGTNYAKAGIPWIPPDAVTLYRYQNDTDYTVLANGAPLALSGFYAMEKLHTQDGYGVFFGGNYGLLEITQGAADNRPCLLVIKDSYANALLPFLARHYRLLVADPRYAPPALHTLLARADRVLVLCGEATLAGSFAEKSI